MFRTNNTSFMQAQKYSQSMNKILLDYDASFDVNWLKISTDKAKWPNWYFKNVKKWVFFCGNWYAHWIL